MTQEIKPTVTATNTLARDEINGLTITLTATAFSDQTLKHSIMITKNGTHLFHCAYNDLQLAAINHQGLLNALMAMSDYQQSLFKTRNICQRTADIPLQMFIQLHPYRNEDDNRIDNYEIRG